MIPTKMLVYRSPDGATRTEALLNTRRRKKSCSELFHNGYRVKMLHAPVCEKEERDDSQHTLSSCFHAVLYWGKNWCWNPHGSMDVSQSSRNKEAALSSFTLVFGESCLVLIWQWFLRHGTKQNTKNNFSVECKYTIALHSIQHLSIFVII